jgi:DNA-binding beta-propeller fold protein YncE
MKATAVNGLLLAAAVLIAFALSSGSGSIAAADGDAPHIGDGGLPQFEVDSKWPQIPRQFRTGPGSAVHGDDRGSIWILSRPKVAAALPEMKGNTTRRPAPPVMEFDQSGKYLQGWGGGSGPGYQWPSNEHGLTLDSSGFVWIVGNADGKSNNPAGLPNDNQILKFTRSGQFVMAIGRSGQTGSNKTEVLRGATALAYSPRTNEIFVADGYGNARVIAFNADTGRFTKMWGAYGGKPLDAADRPAASPPAAMPWVRVAEVLQQFQSPVHDIKISNDGLVYVADRGNRRIQVFTLDGVFVAEQFVGLDSRYTLQARGIAFSPDQRFMYVGGTPVIYILNRKTLEVLGTFQFGEPGQPHPPGHQIGSDKAGNLYVAQADVVGADGKSEGPGAYKYVFKGYSARKPCCSGPGVKAGN